MSDPLSIAASVAGLVSLVQTLTPLLVRFVGSTRSYPTEFKVLAKEIQAFCGILSQLKHVIDDVQKSGEEDDTNCSSQNT